MRHHPFPPRTQEWTSPVMCADAVENYIS